MSSLRTWLPYNHVIHQTHRPEAIKKYGYDPKQKPMEMALVQNWLGSDKTH